MTKLSTIILDVDFLADPKIDLLLEKFGAIAISYYIRIITSLSREGGRLSYDLCCGLGRAIGASRENFKQFLDFAIEKELFFKDKDKVSSKRILRDIEEVEKKRQGWREEYYKKNPNSKKFLLRNLTESNKNLKDSEYEQETEQESESESEPELKDGGLGEGNFSQGRECFEGNVWLSEEEIELAKMRLSQNGLEHSDFEDAVRTLSDYLRGQNNRFPRDQHFSLLVGKININALLANKRQKELNKKINDPPKIQKSYAELEKEKQQEIIKRVNERYKNLELLKANGKQ